MKSYPVVIRLKSLLSYPSKGNLTLNEIQGLKDLTPEQGPELANSDSLEPKPLFED